MKKVFVSGCYDILHAGHIQFFRYARALGDHLTVCFASAEVLMLAKKRAPSMPDDNKKVVMESIRYIDEVVSSSDLDPTFDFVSMLDTIKPDVVAVTEDDKRKEEKRDFFSKRGIEFIVLPKRNTCTQVSTSSIRQSIKGEVS